MLSIMGSVGAARPTTNPYIVMWAEAVRATGEAEVLPFTWRGAITGGHDVFHLHWAEVLLASPTRLGRIRRRLLLSALIASWRIRRQPVVRTVHNVDRRESGRIDRLLIGLAERSASHEIHLNPVTFDRSTAPKTLILHGDYREWFAPHDRAARIEGRVGYVGLIRPYKGVEGLLDAFGDARRERPGLTLHIAGKPSTPTLARDIARRADRPGVTSDLRYLTDADLVASITASSLIVLPYSQLDNSGSALAALSLERPILVPRNATTEALRDEVGAAWVHLFDGALSGDDITRAIGEVSTTPRDSSPRLDERSWELAGRRHVTAYSAAARRPTRDQETVMARQQDRLTRHLRVRIAIPTFHRPVELRRSLAAVCAQIAAVNARGDITASVVVVDNDPDGGAEDVVSEFPALYAHEPTPGIAAVRNRSLDESSDQDAIILLDDDEVPEAEWLITLVDVYRRSGADGVAGKVLTALPDDAPEWVRASGAFVRPRRQDGQLMPEAASNNLLLDMRAVQESGLAFHQDFGLTGGSDSLFTRQFTAWGARMVWAEHAVVTEQEAPERITRSWALMRAFRAGNTGARVERHLAGSGLAAARARAKSLIGGSVRCGAGAGIFAWGVLRRSLPVRARAERRIARGAGMVAGALGHAHNEYGNRRRRMNLDTGA